MQRAEMQLVIRALIAFLFKTKKHLKLIKITQIGPLQGESLQYFLSVQYSKLNSSDGKNPTQVFWGFIFFLLFWFL